MFWFMFFMFIHYVSYVLVYDFLIMIYYVHLSYIHYDLVYEFIMIFIIHSNQLNIIINHSKIILNQSHNAVRLEYFRNLDMLILFLFVFFVMK